jgi:AraC-like DNA-binding protein
LYKPLQYIDHSKLHPNINYKEYFPSFSLSEYVACYWILNTQGKVNNVPHRILPDACIDLIFDFTANVSFISGIANETANLLLDGTIKTMGIRFLPKAIPFILRSNASEFLNNGYETGYVVKSLQQMADKVLNSADSSQALKIIPDELEIFFKDFKVNDRFLKILEHSLYCKGCSNVRELAAHHEISEKQVTRYFKEYIGLSTKEFLKIVRFQNLLSLIKNRKNNILQHALELGYYDQSHLLKDLNKYFGSTKNIF